MNYKAYLDDTQLNIITCDILPMPYNEAKTQEFISFTLDKESELKIISVEDISSVVIRPKSLGIEYSFSKNSITVNLTKPMNFSVEINGKIIDNLLVFARPTRKMPNTEYKNIIRFEKGIHTVGKLKITEDDTLVYLDEGAYLNGKIEINNCKNVSVIGNGVISEKKYRELPMRIAFDVLGSENIFIQDLTICDSNFWTMRIFSCDNVIIDNVKIIGGSGNNDAFDIVSSKNVLVKNCFTRTWDDSIVIKAFDDHDRQSEHVVFKGSDTDMSAAFEKANNDIHNIEICNCALWNDFARPIEFGVSLRADKVHDIKIHNIDIMHSTTGYPLIGAHHGDRAEIYDVEISDIRVESAPGAQLFDFRITDSAWNFDSKKGKMHDFKFKNISWNEKSEFLPEKSRIEGFSKENNISNFTFENISFCGKTVTSIDEMNLICLDYADNIKVISDDTANKINMVKSELNIVDLADADDEGIYKFKAVIDITNISSDDVEGNIWVSVSPVNICNNKIIYNYSLKKNESCRFEQDFELPAGKYVLRVQSDSMNILSDWKLLTLDWKIKREKTKSNNFVNYYNIKSDGIYVSYDDENIIIESSALKNADNSLVIYSAMPVPVCDNEILFSVEETDFGEAMAVEMDMDKGPVIAPQIRCPAEITYVFYNQPKVEKININELEGGTQRYVIPFEKLGIDKNAKEFLLEIEAKIPEVSKLRYPYTLFHSVIPSESAHMFCKVVKA